MELHWRRSVTSPSACAWQRRPTSPWTHAPGCRPRTTFRKASRCHGPAWRKRCRKPWPWLQA
ncbi:unnamed protein product [Durusdinium trenchii]|uniref:Uncharacterized protein n=1 Tax=Durusdinium trenchii TaxID=1381693 RepID=A0ABP0IPV2_9DINO